MNVFIILQLFRSVPTLPKIVLGREQTEENNIIARHANISDILTLLSLLSADAKLAVLLRVSLNKTEVRNFPLLHFPRWLCLVHGQFAMSLLRMKRSVVCKCQCFCLFDIQQWSVLS